MILIQNMSLGTFSILTQVWVRTCMPDVLICSLAHLRGLPSCFRKWASCGLSGHCELAWLRICRWAFQCLSWWSHLDNGEPRMVQLQNDEKLSSWLQFNCVCCCQLAADCFSFSSRQCFDNLFWFSDLIIWDCSSTCGFSIRLVSVPWFHQHWPVFPTVWRSSVQQWSFLCLNGQRPGTVSIVFSWGGILYCFRN